MNLSKKMIACAGLVIALFTVTSASAQRGDTAAMRQRQEQQVAKMKDDLKLTQAQADSLNAINRDYSPKMREIFSDQSMSQDDRRAKMMSIRQEQMKRIEAALGAETAKKVQDWMQANRPQRGGGGGGN